jgi:hypothetical protein
MEYRNEIQSLTPTSEICVRNFESEKENLLSGKVMFCLRESERMSSEKGIDLKKAISR